MQVFRARYATMAVLFCNGLLYATWGVSVAAIKEKFAVSEGVLAAAMAAVAIGGILTMARAGQWIARVGTLAIAVGVACFGWLWLSYKSGGKPWELSVPRRPPLSNITST